MAKYNEILTGRHNRFIQKLFSMKGAAPASQLSGDVQMVHPFFHGAENRLLESWSLWGAANNTAAAGALVGSSQLRVPPNTNVCAVVEKISVSTDANSKFTMTMVQAQTDQLTVSGSSTRDTRQNPLSSSVAIFSSGTVAQTTQLILGIEALPGGGTNLDVILDEDQEIVITPGWILRLINGTVNTAFVVTMWWRERALEESEVFK